MLRDDVPSCRQFAEDWKARAWADLELSPTEPEGWNAEADVVHCEPQNSIAVGELAPRAWSAIQQLCGGQHRVHEPYWCDKFIINFGMNKDLPWQSPDEMASAGTGGWHADGWHFKHFLDSPGVIKRPLSEETLFLQPHLYCF